jgi:hypothetical protein
MAACNYPRSGVYNDLSRKPLPQIDAAAVVVHNLNCRRMNMPRRITCTAYLWGEDHESFGRNEFGSKNVTNQVILSDEQPQNVLQAQLRWGGECRIELEVVANMLAEGRVRVICRARLFEGTSEDTTDLEDDQTVERLIARGVPENIHIALSNDGFGGGDKGTVDITVLNTLVED